MALRVAKASPAFIQKLAQEYLNDYSTMKKLAKLHGTSPGTISNILFRGVVESIIDGVTTVALIQKITTSTENIYLTKKRWEKAADLREADNVEEEIRHLKRCIDEVDFQLETYDDFFFDESDAPSKKSLKCKRSNLHTKLITLQERLNKLKG